MWFKWFPWRWVVSRVARARGFIDPIAVLSHLHRFAQPSEVSEPIELLRAGMVFHARGLINTRAIQHNLDWCWPYWVEQQFNPQSPSFIPRAFSLTHVNLSRRNWTAIGLPDVDYLPVVDPRGLLTPHFDGWSIDVWLLGDEGTPLLPARCAQATQRLVTGDELIVDTRCEADGLQLRQQADVVMADDGPVCRLRIEAAVDRPGHLAVALRPTNPEGVSFIHQVDAHDDRRSLLVNRRHVVRLHSQPDRIAMSEYARGDVLERLRDRPDTDSIVCDIGMATAAALYRVEPDRDRHLTLTLPLDPAQQPTVRQKIRAAVASGKSAKQSAAVTGASAWSEAMGRGCTADLPDAWMQKLFDIARHSVILHSPGDVYPGPYTYKRFWFRDAAFILHALLVIGHGDRVKRCLDTYPSRQTMRGYFRSQEGEWDSNGQAIWIIQRWAEMTGRRLDPPLIQAVRKGAQWIANKRVSGDPNSPHAGLMPAGFSAEHLGPNDFYYWDDFWSVAGLRSAESVLADAGDEQTARWAREQAADMLQAIDRSLDRSAVVRDRKGVPASPYRRMDAGAIGSLAADYPTHAWRPGDPRMVNTVELLMTHFSVRGGFFQDMIHSGINAYLTLHMAQVLLRAGDPRFFTLMQTVADLASPTGQWPEAIHPHTRGGCMGDGHHVWASAEWLLMVRNCFAYEQDRTLVLARGIGRPWLDAGRAMRLGPTPTRFGEVSVRVEPDGQRLVVGWSGDWRRKPAMLHVAPIGWEAVEITADQIEAEGSVTLQRDPHAPMPGAAPADAPAYAAPTDPSGPMNHDATADATEARR